MIDSEDSFRSFRDNIEQISIVAPQEYRVNEEGVVWGNTDARMRELALEHDVKVMPLIINPGFDPDLLHALLNDELARKRSIDMMIGYAKERGYYGWQFDYEHLRIIDRDVFTQYYRETADAFREVGLKLSIAVVPRESELPGPGAYHRWLFDSWRAGYDLQELARIGDFLSIMTYSQHTRRTPPGPVASTRWIENILIHLINELEIDPNKISLGIPFYSTYWFPNYNVERGGFVDGRGMAHRDAIHLIEQHNASITWVEDHQSTMALWENGGVFEYIFLEDARSLAPKLDIMKQYELRGFSVWRLGQEDPEMWNVIDEKTTRK